MIFFACTAVCAHAQNDAASWAEKATTAFEAGRYTEAKTYFDQLIKKNPTLSAAYFNRAVCHILIAHGGNDDWETAIAGVSTEALRPAIADFSLAIKHEPSDADAYFGRAMSHKASGDWSQALADADKAAQINPQYRELASQLRTTRYTRWLWPAIFVIGGIFCVFGCVPLFNAIRQIAQAEKHANQE